MPQLPQCLSANSQSMHSVHQGHHQLRVTGGEQHEDEKIQPDHVLFFLSVYRGASCDSLRSMTRAVGFIPTGNVREARDNKSLGRFWKRQLVSRRSPRG